MRIVYTCQYIHFLGGLERIICDKASALARRGHEVCLITSSDADKKIAYDIDPGVRIIHLGEIGGNVFRRAIAKLRQDLRVWRELCKFRPDILIATPSWLSLAFIFSPKNLLLESHSARRTVFSEESRPGYKLLKSRLAERKAKAVVTLTDEDAASWPAAREVVTIPNYSDMSMSVPMPSRQEAVSVMRLSPPKLTKLMVRAWADVVKAHPQAVLRIFGDGPLREQTAEEIARLGLERNVILAGETKTPAKEYAAHRFMLMASTYEGLPLSIIEAMQCGRPVVATDCPTGPREIITNGVDGFLVEARGLDSESIVRNMSEACIRLLSDPALCERMGKAAKESSARYDKQKILDRWENLFRRVSAGGR